MLNFSVTSAIVAERSNRGGRGATAEKAISLLPHHESRERNGVERPVHSGVMELFRAGTQRRGGERQFADRLMCPTGRCALLRSRLPWAKRQVVDRSMCPTGRCALLRSRLPWAKRQFVDRLMCPTGRCALLRSRFPWGVLAMQSSTSDRHRSPCTLRQARRVRSQPAQVESDPTVDENTNGMRKPPPAKQTQLLQRGEYEMQCQVMSP